MARGGINKAVVQKAREALLARGDNPSIDAVRVELGNTGSKSTIHRYLKEIEAYDPRPQASEEKLSEELTELIGKLLNRLMEEGGEAIAHAQAMFDKQRANLEAKLEESQAALSGLQGEHEAQRAALEIQTEKLETSQSSLQSELTRNARLSQNCADLEVRVMEKDEQIRSLEEKHLHARDALEHYRNAIKEQREQEQRRHEGQLQQVQVEVRQLQQIQAIKQDELMRLNRDNERLLGESRQQSKVVRSLEASIEHLSGEVDNLKASVAKAGGAREMLQDQIAELRTEAKAHMDALSLAEGRAYEAEVLLEESQADLSRLRQEQSGQVND
jgi:chromosome segregation ATPase